MVISSRPAVKLKMNTSQTKNSNPKSTSEASAVSTPCVSRPTALRSLDGLEDPTTKSGSQRGRPIAIHHPSLEYPPLYFVLERFFPRRLKQVEQYYVVRRHFAHALAKRIPGSKLWRRIGVHLTYADVLVLIPLIILASICFYQTFLEPSVSVTGKISRLAVVITLVLGQKNSYVTLVLGIPCDRALIFHKMAGYTAFVTGLMHGIAFFYVQEKEAWGLDRVFAGSINTSGTMIVVFMGCIALTSLPVVRRFFFEIFYLLHLTFLVGIVVATAFHTGATVPTAVLLTTGLDFLIRKVYMERIRYRESDQLNGIAEDGDRHQRGRPIQATIKPIADSVVVITFSNPGFLYNPGQYVYLTVPEISSFQWHPFSFGSSPHDSVIMLYVRKCGNWTTSLYELAVRKQRLHSKNGSEKQTVDILVDGPYGNFAIDVMNKSRYKLVLCISGGVGLAPMQSIAGHLLAEHKAGARDLKLIRFVWIERDPQLIMDTAIYDAHRNKQFQDKVSGVTGEGSNTLEQTDKQDPELKANIANPNEEGKKKQSKPWRQHLSLGSKLLAFVPQCQYTNDEDEDDGVLTWLDHGHSIRTASSDSTHCASTRSMQKPTTLDCRRYGNVDDGAFEHENEVSNTIGLPRMDNSVDGWLETLAKQKIIGPMQSSAIATQHQGVGSKAEANNPFEVLKEPKRALGVCEKSSGAHLIAAVAALENKSNRGPSLQAPSRHAYDLSDQAAQKSFDATGCLNDVLETEIFLTCPLAAESLSLNDDSILHGITCGRPNLAAVFCSMKERALELGEKRVAVCVCGPRRIAQLCRKASIKLSDGKVRFDYHEESFC